MTASIEIRVVEHDALEYSVFVLALKYAQELYGLDAAVVERTGVSEDDLPAQNRYRLVRRTPGIAAAAVLFIGVAPLREFSYSGIQRFGRQAMSAAAKTLPSAQEIALTLHGAGYGLDEIECFQAEIAGVIEAIESDDVPPALRAVTFLEVSQRRAERMRAVLADSLGSEPAVVPRRGSERVAPPVPVEEVHALRRDGRDPEHAFVAMPFDAEFSDRFHYGVSRAVRASGLVCERIDQQSFTGDILERMRDRIRSARLLVADLTGMNANVFLEVGFAWATTSRRPSCVSRDHS